MKTIYWDVSDLRGRDGPIGVFSSKVHVVPAGITFLVMSPREREQMPQYGEIEERYGISFFFEDRDVPNPPFFAVPHLELFAQDRKGGWFGMMDDEKEEVYYITRSEEPFQVTRSRSSFARRLLAGEDWRELWEPTGKVTLYPSKEVAAQAVELVPLADLLPKKGRGGMEDGLDRSDSGPDAGAGPEGH